MKKVLLSGNCDFDHPRIEALVQKNFDCEVSRAKSNEEARKLLDAGNFDLAIVNRVGAFDGQEGIDIVRYMTGNEKLKNVPVMLITNIKEKMEEAVKAGAQEGFGKEELGGERVIDLLRQFLG
ncbi:MAG: hypothetical protein ACE5FU_04415 [Nitrospinota bacterium]